MLHTRVHMHPQHTHTPQTSTSTHARSAHVLALSYAFTSYYVRACHHTCTNTYIKLFFLLLLIHASGAEVNTHIERHPAVVHELVNRVGSQQAVCVHVHVCVCVCKCICIIYHIQVIGSGTPALLVSFVIFMSA